MQAKLLEAVASQRETARQLQEACQAFDSERARLEQQVRSSREEGSVRIHTLEDTIRKLGNRSDLHQVHCLAAVPDHTCIGHAALHFAAAPDHISRPCGFTSHQQPMMVMMIEDTSLVADVPCVCLSFWHNLCTCYLVYVTLHCIALHYIALHCIALHCIALHYIASHHIISYHIISYHIILYYIILYYIILYYVVSYYVVSYYVISCHVIS